MMIGFILMNFPTMICGNSMGCRLKARINGSNPLGLGSSPSAPAALRQEPSRGNAVFTNLVRADFQTSVFHFLF